MAVEVRFATPDEKAEFAHARNGEPEDLDRLLVGIENGKIEGYLGFRVANGRVLVHDVEASDPTVYAALHLRAVAEIRDLGFDRVFFFIVGELTDYRKKLLAQDGVQEIGNEGLLTWFEKVIG